MSDEFDRPEVRPDADMRDHGWRELDENGQPMPRGDIGGVSWTGSMGGSNDDEFATPGDLAGTANGGVTVGPNFDEESSMDADDPMEADRGRTDDRAARESGSGGQGTDPWLEAFERADLPDVDPEGGTPLAGPQDRTDVGNLRGGQHDAATGGSDLGATTGGGDTGAA